MGLPLQSSYWGNYLFLELAKQMGLPFPDICERCPKIVQGADGPEQYLQQNHPARSPMSLWGSKNISL